MFCWLCNVFCHSLKLTPSPFTLVHCHLAFWWAPNVFHCPMNAWPSHSFIILCLLFYKTLPPFYVCLSWSCVSVSPWHVSLFYKLKSPLSHVIVVILYFFVSFGVFCCFIKLTPPPFIIIVVLFFLRTQIALLSVLLIYEVWPFPLLCSFCFMNHNPFPSTYSSWFVGLWRVTHSSCFSQFVKSKSLVSFLLVCGFWSPCFVFLGFKNLIPLPYYFLFMKVDTFVLFITFVLVVLEPKPLSWLSCSPPPPTLSYKHLFLTSLLQQCYNMSFHLHSNPCPYFGFSLIFYYTLKNHLFIPKKVGP